MGDTQNILRYAPDSAMVGRSYPGDAQYRALAGEGPYTSNETGPLGSEHSAYAPIRNREGQVVGYVVVGLYLALPGQRHPVHRAAGAGHGGAGGGGGRPAGPAAVPPHQDRPAGL